MKISRGYKGMRYDEMVADVMKKLNRENDNLKKRTYAETTLSDHNVIVPNWTPFQAINFFASRSLSADIEPVEQEEGSDDPPPTARPIGSLFVFYEKFVRLFCPNIPELFKPHTHNVPSVLTAAQLPVPPPFITLDQLVPGI